MECIDLSVSVAVLEKDHHKWTANQPTNSVDGTELINGKSKVENFADEKAHDPEVVVRRTISTASIVQRERQRYLTVSGRSVEQLKSFFSAQSGVTISFGGKESDIIIAQSTFGANEDAAAFTDYEQQSCSKDITDHAQSKSLTMETKTNELAETIECRALMEMEQGNGGDPSCQEDISVEIPADSHMEDFPTIGEEKCCALCDGDHKVRNCPFLAEARQFVSSISCTVVLACSNRKEDSRSDIPPIDANKSVSEDRDSVVSRVPDTQESSSLISIDRRSTETTTKTALQPETVPLPRAKIISLQLRGFDVAGIEAFFQAIECYNPAPHHEERNEFISPEVVKSFDIAAQQKLFPSQWRLMSNDALHKAIISYASERELRFSRKKNYLILTFTMGEPWGWDGFNPVLVTHKLRKLKQRLTDCSDRLMTDIQDIVLTEPRICEIMVLALNTTSKSSRFLPQKQLCDYLNEKLSQREIGNWEIFESYAKRKAELIGKELSGKASGSSKTTVYTRKEAAAEAEPAILKPTELRSSDGLSPSSLSNSSLVEARRTINDFYPSSSRSRMGSSVASHAIPSASWSPRRFHDYDYTNEDPWYNERRGFKRSRDDYDERKGEIRYRDRGAYNGKYERDGENRSHKRLDDICSGYRDEEISRRSPFTRPRYNHYYDAEEVPITFPRHLHDDSFRRPIMQSAYADKDADESEDSNAGHDSRREEGVLGDDMYYRGDLGHDEDVEEEEEEEEEGDEENTDDGSRNGRMQLPRRVVTVASDPKLSRHSNDRDDIAVCFCCGRRHPDPRCHFWSHPDANHNKAIRWVDSPGHARMLELESRGFRFTTDLNVLPTYVQSNGQPWSVPRKENSSNHVNSSRSFKSKTSRGKTSGNASRATQSHRAVTRL